MRVSIGRRFLSALIDRILITIHFIIISLIVFGPYRAPGLMGYSLGQMGQTPDITSSPLYNFIGYQDLYLSFVVIFYAVKLMYFLVLELTLKRTFGKVIFGIEYTTSTGDKPNIAQFFIKSISSSILFSLFYILLYNFVTITNWLYPIISNIILISPVIFLYKNQTFYDIIAGVSLSYSKKEKKKNADVVERPNQGQIEIIEGNAKNNDIKVQKQKNDIPNGVENLNFKMYLKTNKKVFMYFLTVIFTLSLIFSGLNYYTYKNDIAQFNNKVYNWKIEKTNENIKTYNNALKEYQNKLTSYENDFKIYDKDNEDYITKKNEYDKAYLKHFNKYFKERKLFVLRVKKWYYDLNNKNYSGTNFNAKYLFDTSTRNSFETINWDNYDVAYLDLLHKYNNIDYSIKSRYGMPGFWFVPDCLTCPDYPIKPSEPVKPVKPTINSIEKYPFSSYEDETKISSKFWDISLDRNILQNIQPCIVILLIVSLSLVAILLLYQIFIFNGNKKYIFFSISLAFSFVLLNYILRYYIYYNYFNLGYSNYGTYSHYAGYNILDNLFLYFGLLFYFTILVYIFLSFIYERRIKYKNSKVFPFNTGINRLILSISLLVPLFSEVQYIVNSNWIVASYAYKNLFQFQTVSNSITTNFSGLFLFVGFLIIYCLIIWIYDGFVNKIVQKSDN